MFLERADAHARVDPSLHGASFSRLSGSRPGRLGAACAAGPAARPRGPAARRDVGRRPRGSAAADAGDAAVPAGVRQPRDGRDRVRPPARADAPPGRARPAHRPAQPPRPAGAHRRRDRAHAARSRVLVCDLDNFKRVNDALGYVQGDEALRRFAGVLAESRRPGRAARRRGVRARAAGHATRTPRWRPPSASAPRSSHVFADFPWPVTTSVGVAVSGPGAETRVAAAARRHARGVRRQAARPRPLHRLPRRDARAAARHARGRRRRVRRAARRRDAAGRDARPARRRHRAPLADRRPLRRGDRPRARAAPTSRVERIRAAGVLHDLGKLGVADAVLKKPGTLTDEEWAEMRRHPELGARILDHANLRDISALGARPPRADRRPRLPARPGGRRDPARGADPRRRRRLRGDDRRPRRTAPRSATTRRARSCGACAGTQFDPRVVDAFLRVLAAAAGREPSAHVCHTGGVTTRGAGTVGAQPNRGRERCEASG